MANIFIIFFQSWDKEKMLFKLSKRQIELHIDGFQLEFVSISQIINHMTCYKWKCSHWWKIHLKKKSVTRFALQSECCNFNQWEHWIYNRSCDHNPAYTYKFQLKTTLVGVGIGPLWKKLLLRNTRITNNYLEISS